MSNTRTNKNKFLIVVAGPTAVGKTAVAIELGKIFKAEIFSADSRQLYQEMNIGTAKPSKNELIEVKHHFINHISIHQKYSAGQYEQEVNSALNQYFEHRDVAILSGGTGLYIKVSLEGLDELPEVSDEILEMYNHKYESFGIQSLLDELSLKDHIYYNKVDKANHRRIIRALSVIKASGKPYSSFLSTDKQKSLPFNVVPILLELPRHELYDRINNRVEQMLAQGLQKEVEQLYEHKSLQALETVGYQEIFDWMDGLQSFEMATSMIKQNSRRYAKRQITWFKKHGDWHVFSPLEIEKIIRFAISEVRMVY
ncbi:MAG TPA: tRNA (adenosine(37)-N6)-dimethylallyltransferase MiaA [Saprospiraceae bacterium]|nr:tRNA (adenosine(37)-N6)-dimethylallyltransferase MiaA [Saprospiraceae bacterium]